MRVQAILDKSKYKTDKDGNRIDKDYIERRLAELDAQDAAEDDVVENMKGANRGRCRAKNQVTCPTHGTGANNHQASNQRSSQGDRRGHTDHPKEIQPTDSKRQIKKKMTQAFKDAREGKNVDTGYEITPGKEVIFRQASAEHGGPTHADRPAHPIRIPSERLAEAMLHGDKENDRGNDITAIDKNGVRVIFTPDNEFPNPKEAKKRKKRKRNKMTAKNWYKKK